MHNVPKVKTISPNDTNVQGGDSCVRAGLKAEACFSHCVISYAFRIGYYNLPV